MNTTLAYGLLVAQVLMNLPQIRKVLVSRDVKGVTFAGEMLTAISGAGWLAFGLTTGDTLLLTSGFLSIVTYTPTAALAWRFGGLPTLREMELSLAALAAVIIAVAGLLPMSLLLTILGLLMYGPYVWTAARQDTLSGVSVPASLFRALYGLAWLSYAVSTSATSLGIWAVTTTTSFLYVAARAGRRNAGQHPDTQRLASTSRTARLDAQPRSARRPCAATSPPTGRFPRRPDGKATVFAPAAAMLACSRTTSPSPSHRNCTTAPGR